MQAIHKRRDYNPISRRGYLMNIKTSNPFHCAYVNFKFYKQEIKREFDIKRHPYLQHNRKFPWICTRKFIQRKKWRIY